MTKDTVRTLNDLALLFSAKPIAVPLILLLIFKLYTLEPATFFYTLGLLLLTTLFVMRWCIHLIAAKKLTFLAIYKEMDKDNHRSS
jgi:hypothetical protein